MPHPLRTASIASCLDSCDYHESSVTFIARDPIVHDGLCVVSIAAKVCAAQAAVILWQLRLHLPLVRLWIGPAKLFVCSSFGEEFGH